MLAFNSSIKNFDKESKFLKTLFKTTRIFSAVFCKTYVIDEI